ncbi:unnamed protein product [Nezara viridula]|uniref:Uncharacterized protein n=1 Tax=Nezara viridula TaxID=85310 RepID=A0A9P0MMK5_NEZVI|nr:unnamed protein product [Nezara viridula]
MIENTNDMNENKKGQGLCPLTDEEVIKKMKYFENLIGELVWRRIIFDKHCEDERTREYRETKATISKISAIYKKKEQLVVKDSNMFESRMAGAARLLILQEKDKNVTDVVLAVHRRLGRVDHAAHKKAYRRILYALIVQGLCRVDPNDSVGYEVSALRVVRGSGHLLDRGTAHGEQLVGCEVGPAAPEGLPHDTDSPLRPQQEPDLLRSVQDERITDPLRLPFFTGPIEGELIGRRKFRYRTGTEGKSY